MSTLNSALQGNFTTHSHLYSVGCKMNSFSALGWTISSPRKHSSPTWPPVIITMGLRFAAIEAISDSVSSNCFPLEGNVNCIALFNHEEIGSVSTTGAESSLIPSLLHRLSPSPALLAQSIAKSLLVSADMGHAVHPNYASKHEDNHRPQINGGIVIKTNAKQRYASDAIGTFIVKKLLEKKGGKVQEFEVRNDMYVNQPPCPFAFDVKFKQALWVNRWPHAVQARHAHCRCWLRDALDALHPGDRRVTRRRAHDRFFYLFFRGIRWARSPTFSRLTL
jgi:Aminopeptidase I zinc metalloprotease (M18)